MKKNPDSQMPEQPDTQTPAAEQPDSRGLWQHVKVTPAERLAWKAAAATAGLTVADLIRQRMDTKPEGRAPKKTRAARRADPELIRAIGRVGNNMNQIAKWCNTYAESRDAVQVLAALVSIEQMLKDFSSYRPAVPVIEDLGHDD